MIANAKAFNPPGTIYHTEAERIEAWGSEHISKASAHVIEYETDWNIEIERDEEVNVDADEGDGAGASGGPATPSRRSPSAGSPFPTTQKRVKGGNKKGPSLSETLEADGHLPGYKDGLSAFPPGSDLAALLVTLKLKGEKSINYPDCNHASMKILRKALPHKERAYANGEGRTAICGGRKPGLSRK